MHWIIADLLMFVSSVILFLTVRYAALQKLPSQLNNLAMFGVPAIIYSVISLGHLPEYARLTPWLWLVLLLTGIFLAYISNAASLRSIALAPNPGYSLVISKSSVVLTVFLAVPFFGTPLTWEAIMAVGLIVVFSAFIMVNPRRGEHARSAAWLPLALVAFVGWAFLSLAAKYLFVHGVSTLVFLAGLFVVVSACIGAEIRYKSVPHNLLRQRWKLFLAIGCMSAVWNFFLFYAINIAPNPGYVNATNAASIAAVAGLAVAIFKDDFSLKKFIGIAGVLAGLLLLFLG